MIKASPPLWAHEAAPLALSEALVLEQGAPGWLPTLAWLSLAGLALALCALAFLARALGRLRRELAHTRAARGDFCANLRHEIRTPLAVIRSDAELLLGLAPRALAPEAARLQRIIERVQDIDASLECASGLAQAGFDDVCALNVRACVHAVSASLRLEAEQAGLLVHNMVADDFIQTASCSALGTVLRNLLHNAVLHAAPAVLELRSFGQSLVFTDTGPGIAAADLARVFERDFSSCAAPHAARGAPAPALASSERHGLGLALAKQICALHSWDLRLESPVKNARGTRIILNFRPRQESPPSAPGGID